jgi:hypothetical protein
MTLRIEEIGVTASTFFQNPISMQRTSTTFGIHTGNLLTGSAEGGRRSDKRGEKKIGVKNIGYNFGMFRIFLLAVLVSLPLISFHVYEYFTNHNDALIFSNSISMYTEITLLASTFATLRWALFQSILWSPNTQTTPSTIQSFFLQSSRLLKSSILPTLQSPPSPLPPAFASYYSDIIDNQNVCSLIHGQCALGLLGYTPSNYLYYLSSVIAVIDEMHMVWTANENIGMEGILSVPKYRALIHSFLSPYSPFPSISSSLILPLSSSLSPLLLAQPPQPASPEQESRADREGYYLIFVLPISLITAIGLHRLVYAPILGVVFAYWHTGILIPLRLARTNPLLEQYYRSLDRHNKSIFTFF